MLFDQWLKDLEKCFSMSKVSVEETRPSKCFPKPFSSKNTTCTLCASFAAATFLLALFRSPLLQSLQCVRIPVLKALDRKVNGNQSQVQSTLPKEKTSSNPSVVYLQRPSASDVLCNAHWTWSGIANFWTVVDKREGHISWTIERAQSKRRERAQWSRGKACWKSKIRKGTAVVAIQAVDRFSPNPWHHLTAIFEAWVTPKILQQMKILPNNISVSYQVVPTSTSSVENSRGVFKWQMLGPIAKRRCDFEHDIIAPADGFLWDLAWDLYLQCARGPDLWREFQTAPWLKMNKTVSLMTYL